MWRILTIPIICALLVAACLISCGGDGRFYSRDEVEDLKAGMLKHARLEMNRFQKADLEYKDTVRFFKWVNHPFEEDGGNYAKAYRQFTDVDIEDIRYSDSLLLPLRFDVVYTYEIMSTKPHTYDEPDAEKLAAQETGGYEKLRVSAIRLSYYCDFDGTILKAPPDPPEMSIYEEVKVARKPTF